MPAVVAGYSTRSEDIHLKHCSENRNHFPEIILAKFAVENVPRGATKGSRGELWKVSLNEAKQCESIACKLFAQSALFGKPGDHD